MTTQQEHFDTMVEETGAVWWGGTTPAGIDRFRRRARMIAKALNRFPDPYVMEMGCGAGAVTQHILAERPGLRLFGCDISPKCIEKARETCGVYPHAEFEVRDALATGFPDATFDAVVGISILHHVNPLEPLLKEIHRVLRPGGVIWFSEPNMMNPEILLEKNLPFLKKAVGDSEDETAIVKGRLKAQLADAGFTQIHVVPFDFLHPITPKFLIAAVDRIGRVLERTPLVRNIAGSVLIQAVK